jgi:hypothetical protein
VEECLSRIEGAVPLRGATNAAVAELAAARVQVFDGDALHELADALQVHIGRLHDAISAGYFSGRALVPESGTGPDERGAAGPS